MNKDLEGMICRAKEIALKAHKGQKRKNGDPYYTHPQAVAKILEDRKVSSIFIAVAWLHDVVEDTKWTLEDLCKEGMPEIVVSMVDMLTKRKGEKYLDYILRVKETQLAIPVKLADMEHNSGDLPKGDKRNKYIRQKYELARYILEN